MISSATISDCGTYRYRLGRQWDADAGTVTWVMINPSTADAYVDDHTIRRCVGFAKGWGYGAIEVVNLFALRSSDPRALRMHPDPVGPENPMVLAEAVERAHLLMVAWGASVERVRSLGEQAITRVMYTARHHDRMAFCLGKTKGGHPRHPLMVEETQQPLIYEGGRTDGR